MMVETFFFEGALSLFGKNESSDTQPNPRRR